MTTTSNYRTEPDTDLTAGTVNITVLYLCCGHVKWIRTIELRSMAVQPQTIWYCETCRASCTIEAHTTDQVRHGYPERGPVPSTTGDPWAIP
jgi:hypothetical protein